MLLGTLAHENGKAFHALVGALAHDNGKVSHALLGALTAVMVGACLGLSACSSPAEVSSSSVQKSPLSDVSDTRISSEVQAQIDAKEKAKREAQKAEEERKRAEAEAARIAALDMSSKVTARSVLKAVPKDKSLKTFSMSSDRTAPTLSSEANKAILDATHAIEEAGYTCGAIIIDTKTGLGIAYNADTPIYTASSFKAPFSFFVLENGEATESDRSLITSSILHSDNEGFEALAQHYYLTDEYKNWVDEHGITYDSWSPWYPDASAGAMAACWADIFQYVESKDTDAAWFKDLLANTNISFIRRALEGENIDVYNKGGWLADPEYNAVADCGIVHADDRNYIVAVLSDQPSHGEAQQRVQDIVRTLWDAHDALS